MSKVIKWESYHILPSRREKLINILFSEIIFLKKKSKDFIDQKFFKISLEKLEYLLNIVRDNETELSEKNFNRIILIIYKIFQVITEEIKIK